MDFIHLEKNFLTSDECKKAIKYYTAVEKLGLTYVRNAKSGPVDDNFFSFSELVSQPEYPFYENQFFTNTFIQRFFSMNGVYQKYVDKYNILTRYSQHGIPYIKVQKTKPSQGFHKWHTDIMAPQLCRRILAFIVYLNTVDEGGETEFLYLGKRIKPVEGTLMIHPLGLPYTHRGNPPINKTKYIATGWVEFI